jgi:GNAT superfamily N-acetyltransferase
MAGRYGLEIRAAVGADAPGLADLLSQGGGRVEARSLAERLTQLQEGGAVLLALEWGPPSGVVVLHWRPDLVGERPLAAIDFILVGAEQRRRGLGRLLIKAAAQRSRLAGCGAMSLRAAAEADGLEAFCHATGFVKGGGATFTRPLRKAG